MPNYNIDDFLPALVDGIAKYEDRWVGVPYDIPIFIMIYRKDIYDKLGLKAPATMDELLGNSEKIFAEMGKDGVYGTSGQMKSGHYSLECDWTAWLWGHGGSIFNKDGKFVGNDERGLEAIAYWDKLKATMPPGVDGWTWDGQGNAVAQGVAASMLSWGEFFPSFDDPAQSKVSGLCEVAVPPAATMPGLAPGLWISVWGPVRVYGMAPAASATAIPFRLVEFATYVVFAGMASNRVAPTEASRPRLDTRIVYVMMSPSFTDGVAVDTVLRTRSSERGRAHEPRSPTEPTPTGEAWPTRVVSPVVMSTRYSSFDAVAGVGVEFGPVEA